MKHYLGFRITQEADGYYATRSQHDIGPRATFTELRDEIEDVCIEEERTLYGAVLDVGFSLEAH